MTAPAVPDARLRAAIERLELRSIVTQRCSAERTGPGLPNDLDVMFESGIAMDATTLNYRFQAVVSATSDDGDGIATVEAVLLLTYSIDGDDPLDEHLCNEFGQRVAWMTAFPYIRETVQSLGTRVGLPGLVLGMVRAGEGEPRAVSSGDGREHRAQD